MFEIFRIEKRATDFDSICFYSKNFKYLTNALFMTCAGER